MTRMLKGALALAAMVGAAAPVVAQGGNPLANGYNGAASGGAVYSTAGYANGAAMAGDCGVSASAGVSYVDQVMTGYRNEVRTRTVNQTVSRLVTREVEEAYTY